MLEICTHTVCLTVYTRTLFVILDASGISIKSGLRIITTMSSQGVVFSKFLIMYTQTHNMADMGLYLCMGDVRPHSVHVRPVSWISGVSGVEVRSPLSRGFHGSQGCRWPHGSTLSQMSVTYYTEFR